MYMYTQGHSRVVSTGVYIPESRLTSREIMEEIDSKNRFGISPDWIERTMGIAERRTAPPDMLPSDMATMAAMQALESAGITALDIDAIIFAGAIRDYLIEPSTAHVVQSKIGARGAIAFDVTNACHGFMNGIHLMDALIATGQARRGLIVSGEQGSRFALRAMNEMRKTTDRNTFSKLAAALTLGDAGAAMVLGPKLDPDTGFAGFMLQSQGQHSSLCTCGKENGDANSLLLETDMPTIIDNGIEMLGNMYDIFMQKLGWKPEEIAQFVHHQVAVRTFKRHAAYAKISLNIMPNTVSTLGNLITANIPVNLHLLKENQRIKHGQKVFIAGAGSGLAVSQAGLIWEAV